METRPTLTTKAYTIILTYQTRDIPSATLHIPVSELYPGKEEDFVKQYKAKKGPLYADWRKKRPEIIRKDLERRRKTVPERITI